MRLLVTDFLLTFRMKCRILSGQEENYRAASSSDVTGRRWRLFTRPACEKQNVTSPRLTSATRFASASSSSLSLEICVPRVSGGKIDSINHFLTILLVISLLGFLHLQPCLVCVLRPPPTSSVSPFFCPFFLSPSLSRCFSPLSLLLFIVSLLQFRLLPLILPFYISVRLQSRPSPLQYQ